MHAVLVALILRALALYHPGLERTGDVQDVAEAIADTVTSDAGNAPLTGSHAEDAVLLAVYAAHESGLRADPVPSSWDARAGVSCGPWQMRCGAVRYAPLSAQAATWLRWARAGGLGGLDSSPARARRRAGRAHALLARAIAMP